jgi:hypothetical protein
LQALQAHPTSLPHYCSDSVWTMPLSLAATYGISIDFFSSCYSDVSVRKGSRSPKGTGGAPKGSSYEVAFGNPRINRCMLLPEAYRSLPRPSSSSKPSHPPYSVSASDVYIFDERLRNLCTTIIAKRNITLLRPSTSTRVLICILLLVCALLLDSQKANRPPIVTVFFLRR